MIRYQIINPDLFDHTHVASPFLKMHENTPFIFNEDFGIVKVYKFTLTYLDFEAGNLLDAPVYLRFDGILDLNVNYLMNNNESRSKNVKIKFNYSKDVIDIQVNEVFIFREIDQVDCGDLLIDEAEVRIDSIRNIELLIILIVAGIYAYMCENTKVGHIDSSPISKYLRSIAKNLKSEVIFNIGSVASQNTILNSFRVNDKDTTLQALETSLSEQKIYPKGELEIVNVDLDGAFRISYK